MSAWVVLSARWYWPWAISCRSRLSRLMSMTRSWGGRSVGAQFLGNQLILIGGRAEIAQGLEATPGLAGNLVGRRFRIPVARLLPDENGEFVPHFVHLLGHCRRQIMQFRGVGTQVKQLRTRAESYPSSGAGRSGWAPGHRRPRRESRARGPRPSGTWRLEWGFQMFS